MLVVAERPVVGQEVQEVGHLLQVGRDVGPVAEQVRVVELDADDVLDAVVERAARQCGRRRCRRCLGRGRSRDCCLRRHEGRHRGEPNQASHAKPPCRFRHLPATGGPLDPSHANLTRAMRCAV